MAANSRMGVTGPLKGLPTQGTTQPAVIVIFINM